MATLFTFPQAMPVYAGASVPGGKLYFFQAGTTTPISTYTTTALSVAHDHPVVADADGVFPAIWINEGTNVTYRMQLKTSADVLIKDLDNLKAADTTIELGGQTDTTLSRASAGVLAVEGHNVPTVDQTQTISAAWTFSVQLTGTTAGGAASGEAAFLASAISPRFRFYYTTASANNRIWDLAAGTASFGLYALSDNYGTVVTALQANRTDAAITSVGLYAGGTENFRVDASATATHTRFLVYDVDNATLERVTVGAADSGGSGFKLLRIPN